MRDFIITTDNMADLPDEYYEENQIRCMSLTYSLDGNTYDRDTSIPFGDFYDFMREGKLPVTSQVNPEEAKRVFEPVLKEGKDVLHFAFSSALSGSCNSSLIAKGELEEKYPDAKIYIVDTLCASLGQGLIVHNAVKLKREGKTIDEIYSWANEHKLNVCHVFCVDDLNHLCRGGRVSKTSAFVGTMMNIKPVLYVDNDGRLIPFSKVRGRKKSLSALVSYMEDHIGGYRDSIEEVFISHGDCIEDARYVLDMVKEKFGDVDSRINYVGPTVGAHSGPGTVALFFFGDCR